MDVRREKVSTNMTRDVVCLSPDISLASAYGVMKEFSFRHIPVIENGLLCGVLSDRDILAYARTNDNGELVIDRSKKISEALTLDPITCREGSMISDVAAIMVAKKIDSLPVVDRKGGLVGLITSTDLLILLRDFDTNLSRKVIPFRFNVRQYEPVYA